jgi:hypothetical protein
MAMWVSALKHIPWKTLLTQAPAILESATRLFNAFPRSQGERERNESKGNTVQELQTRLDSLESSYQQTVEIVRQIADQLQAVTGTLHVVAARVRFLLVVSIAGLLLGLVALAVALLV